MFINNLFIFVSQTGYLYLQSMKKISLIILSFVAIFQLGAQNVEFTSENIKANPKLKKALKYVKKGDEFFYSEYSGYNYFNSQALKNYLEAYKINPNSASLNYKTATAYTRSLEKTKALPFALQSKELNEDLTNQIDYVLGVTYHKLGQFDKAIHFFNEYIDNSSTSDSILFAKKHIEECEYAKKKLAEKPWYTVESLGKNINTEYPEYSPLITLNETNLFFTSRRPYNEKKTNQTDGFYEKIFESENRGGWKKPNLLPKPVNAKKKENSASVSLSFDGKTVYLYSEENNGNLQYSDYNNGKWSKPKDLPEPINSEFVESHISVSADGKTAYFISDRPGGVGGKDIWKSTLVNDQWTEPVNLGAPLNTIYDEDGVFIHPDGKTLYFSSKGHNTIGGYDIFESELQDDGTWKEPINLGYPVNDVEDDIFFVLTADGKNAYFSSIRKGGEGLQDIYAIRPFEKAAIKEVHLTVFKGKVIDQETQKPIAAKVVITDNSTSEKLFDETNDKIKGFMVSLPSGKNYGIAVEAEGYVFYSENFDLEFKKGYNEVEKTIELSKPKVGVKVTLNNVFFDFDKYEVKAASKTELDRIIALAKSNSKIKIAIEGHTDNIGEDSYNQLLSQRRADAIKNYLIKNGLPESQIAYAKGFGESKPIDTNSTKEGRQNNRRVEFKIVE